jgi:hypothetical protein
VRKSSWPCQCRESYEPSSEAIASYPFEQRDRCSVEARVINSSLVGGRERRRSVNLPVFEAFPPGMNGDRSIFLCCYKMMVLRGEQDEIIANEAATNLECSTGLCRYRCFS